MLEFAILKLYFLLFPALQTLDCVIFLSFLIDLFLNDNGWNQILLCRTSYSGVCVHFSISSCTQSCFSPQTHSFRATTDRGKDCRVQQAHTIRI